MNDATTDHGTNGKTTPAAAVDCPQCGSKLRLLRPATVHTPIACCICGASFFQQPVETAPFTEPTEGGVVRGQLPRPAIGARPMVRGPVARPWSFDRLGQPGVPPRKDGPPPAITTPAPPLPAAGCRAAPGMPRPVAMPDHMQRALRNRWMESSLLATLVVLVFVGLLAGGFIAATYVSTGSKKTTDSAADAAELPAAAGSQSTARAKPEERPAAALLLNRHALPRPAELLGVWESRVDDGSLSGVEFHADGTVIVRQAGDPPPAPVTQNWYLAERRGDVLELEIGPGFGAMGNTRVTVRVTSPDAMTVIQTVRQGVIQGGTNLRYIRIGK
jgi:hypothetical protein